MQRGDKASQLILQILQQAKRPLETPEVVALVQQELPSCTRTIVFKRLTDLRGDQALNGKHIGSGKGVWIWWEKDRFQTPGQSPPHPDNITNCILQILDNAHTPLETREVEERVTQLVPSSTRALVFKRLTNLRGDQAIRGTTVGSGKGTWIWWRTNAFEA